MHRILLIRESFHSLTYLIIIISSLLMPQSVHSETLDSLRSGLPKQILGWTVEHEDRLFDEKTIFGYINGGAEVYKAYNMRQCLSRRYTTPNGPAIVLDIFDMGSSEDAFGVFTHDTDGEILDVGQDARFQPGWLSFWKDRFFVSIYMEEETEAAGKTVKVLGRKVTSLITRQGTKPRILSLLPSEGLQSRNIRYLHHPIVLNYHYYLSDENILNISHKTDVVLASYRLDKNEARLLLVVYTDPETARKSMISFYNHYLPDADQYGIALLEDGKWAAVLLKERILAIVLEADSRQLAESLLKSIKKNAQLNR